MRRHLTGRAALLAVTMLLAFAACTVPQADAPAPTTEQTAEEASGADTDEAEQAEPDEEEDEAARARKAAQAADYENKVDIWAHPAGYSTEKKEDHMNISPRNWVEVADGMSKKLINTEFADIEEIVDSFYNGYIVGNRLEKETYEDIPYVIPYPVQNAYGAVIVLPGGGFSYKTMNGHTFESKEVAERLNDAGYTAFVLNYRSNPYEYPLPVLDLQRAVRFVRAHADEYGFPEDNISLLGFSAGGYEIASFINIFMGNDRFPEDYEKDDLDDADDTVQSAAMVYPLLDFRHNVPMLFCLFDADTVRDDAERERILDETDLSMHFDSASVPQFLAHGQKDLVVGTDGARRYLIAARKAGTSIGELSLEDAGHLFEQPYYMDAYLNWLGKQ